MKQISVSINSFKDFLDCPEARGLSDKEIALITRSTDRAVHHWRNEQRSPNGSVLAALEGYIVRCRLEDRINRIYEYYQ